MADFRGTPQRVKYVWQARKPLFLPGGYRIQRGDALTPTEEMITAYRDLMVPVGESLLTRTMEQELPPEQTGSIVRAPGRPRREDATG